MGRSRSSASPCPSSPCPSAPSSAAASPSPRSSTASSSRATRCWPVRRIKTGGEARNLLLLAEVLDEARRERLRSFQGQPQRAVPEDLRERADGARHAEED